MRSSQTSVSRKGKFDDGNRSGLTGSQSRAFLLINTNHFHSSPRTGVKSPHSPVQNISHVMVKNWALLKHARLRPWVLNSHVWDSLFYRTYDCQDICYFYRWQLIQIVSFCAVIIATRGNFHYATEKKLLIGDQSVIEKANTLFRWIISR